MLNIVNSKIKQGASGWQPVVVDGDGQASIKVMSIGFLLPRQDDAIIWRGPKKSCKSTIILLFSLICSYSVLAIISQFVSNVEWGYLDYLVVDTPPGTSDEHLTILENIVTQQRPLRALIVTTPQLAAIADVMRIIGFCQTVGLSIVGLVENMSGYLCPHCACCTNVFSREGGRQLAERYQMPFLAQIPIAPSFNQLVEANDARPLTDYPKRVPELYQIFTGLIKHL